jgi:putative phage-type endonuclease
MKDKDSKKESLSSYQIDVLCLKHQFDVTQILDECANEEQKVTKKSILLRIKEIKINRKIVKALLELPKIEQKSEIWYKTRENLITASDFAQALGEGKFGNQADIYRKKVKPSSESNASFSNPFFKWGNMFESVANDIYSLMHSNVTIYEFGLLPHKELSFFGASPDGISEHGIMLEIKCPYKRKIQFGDAVPKQYYYQIQGQLEVCGLNDCDYFECQFHLYASMGEFVANFEHTTYKGVIIEYLSPLDKTTSYKYSKVFVGTQTPLSDAQAWIEENTKEDFVDIKLWYLGNHNLQRVRLDKTFVDNKLLELKAVWDKIIYYRNNLDKFEIEVEKRIDIGDTPRLKPLFEKPVIRGYAFLEDNEETAA